MKTASNPLPRSKIITICLATFLESVSVISAYTYIGYMVLDFPNVDHVTEVGYYTGWIAAASSLCQALSSYFWGALSDKIGRRPIILLGLVGSFISVSLFGFSKNVSFAIIVRSIGGIFDCGQVVKTYLGEITDSTNQAKAFNFIGISWTLGSIVGPLIGGYLSEPMSKYNWFAPHSALGELFTTYPFLLPNLVICAMHFVVVPLACLYLTETRHRGYTVIQDRSSRTFKEGVFDAEAVFEDAPRRCEEIRSIFLDKTVLLVCLLFSLVAFNGVFLGSVLPLWSMTKVADGGLDFTTSDSGMANSISGVVCLFAQLLVCYPMLKSLGVINGFRLSILVAVPSILALTETRFLLPTSPYASGERVFFWIAFIAVSSVYSSAVTFQFTSTSLLLNNSVPNEKLGKVNGLAISMMSVLRTIAPIISSTIFAWSAQYYEFHIISYRFAFVLAALLYISTLALSWKLPTRLNVPCSAQQLQD